MGMAYHPELQLSMDVFVYLSNWPCLFHFPIFNVRHSVCYIIRLQEYLVKWVLKCVQLFATPWTVACQAPLPWDFSGKNTRVGCHFLLHGIFLTQGSNPCLQHLLHCSQILYHWTTSSVQFSSVAQLCLTLCDPMNSSTPGLPVHHQLQESTQIQVHRVGDAIQPSHPLSSPSPPALNLSQHQGLFQWVSSSHQVAKVLEFQLQHQSLQWTPRTDLL